MVMSLVNLFLISKLYAGVFQVDKFGVDNSENIEIILPDKGVKPIMKIVDNPAIVIKNVAEIEVKNKKIILQYNSGASEDPHFIFYWNDGNKKKDFKIGGTRMSYLSNGVFLVSGHTNNMFDVKRKIFFDGKKFEEIKQPFYVIDLSSIALVDGSAHQVTSEKSPVVFSFKKNEELKILLSDSKQEYFLIKNKDGLSGWINIPLNQRPTVFKEIFYAGD